MLGKQKIEILPVESGAFSCYVRRFFLFSTLCGLLEKTFLSLKYIIAGAFLLFEILQSR